MIQIYQQDTKVTGMTQRTVPVATEDTRALFSGHCAMHENREVFFASIEPFTAGHRHIKAGGKTGRRNNEDN